MSFCKEIIETMPSNGHPEKKSLDSVDHSTTAPVGSYEAKSTIEANKTSGSVTCKDKCEASAGPSRRRHSIKAEKLYDASWHGRCNTYFIKENRDKPSVGDNNPTLDFPISPPQPRKGEMKWVQETFKKWCKGVKVEALLELAIQTRNSGNKCVFGQRDGGELNYVFTIRFDDGVEWIAKCPRHLGDNKEEEKKRLQSVEVEIASLMFLQEVGGIPSPKIYGFGPDTRNPSRTPYIFMEKLRGVPLGHAIRNKDLERSSIYRCLDGLADFRKKLREVRFQVAASLRIYAKDNEECKWSIEDLVSPLVVQSYGVKWQTSTYDTGLQYYLAQHTLSSVTASIYWELPDMEEWWIVHSHIGALIPFFVQKDYVREDGAGQDLEFEEVFLLAHLDLNDENILVDPKTGELTGIIDWEYTSTLPFQAVEHYPKFLISEKHVDDMIWLIEKKWEGVDGKAEIQSWRKYYNKHFEDDREISWMNARIEAIELFERMIMDWVECHNFTHFHKVVKALEESGMLPKDLNIPWDYLERMVDARKPPQTPLAETPMSEK